MSTWYDKGVFYHMYPLGMTGAPKKNEDAAVTNRFEELDLWVPHMKELGCSAVYIGPLFESSTHGYDTRDYKLTDRRLGTNEDFRHFVTLCHDSQLKVVVDGVFNHTGREFFAFTDIQKNREASPYRDWYKGINFACGSPLGDSFGYEAWQGHYELPCLNLWNPEVKQYLFEVIKYWITEFDIDGIRLDCANVLDFTFMSEMRRESAGMKEDFWLMGEVIHGDYSRWVNDDMLHSVTNYELHKSLYSGLNDFNCFEIAHNVKRLAGIGSHLYTFVDNHDENRIASKLKEKEHLYSIYLMLYTLPGIPSIYYGSEWAVEGTRTNYSDEALRPSISMTQKDVLHKDLTDYIAKLGRIHLENPEFHGGSYQELLLTNRQFAYVRQNGDDAVIVAVNIDTNPAILSIPNSFSGKRFVNLLDETVPALEGNKITIQIPGSRGVVLKVMED